MNEPRVFQAGNAGPFTFDGTRTFVLGERKVAVVDPGPDDPEHLSRVSRAVEGAEEGVVLVTHGHPDHAAGAPSLARLTGFSVAGRIPGADRALGDGDRVSVDGGWIEVVETPGHARDHLAFLDGRSRELFVGDLLLGEGATTWVGEYPGCVADYLRSLDRVEALSPRRLHPAHGPTLEEPVAAVERFRRHRLERLRQVEDAVRELGSGDAGEEAWIRAVVERVYGPDLPAGVEVAAEWSVRALLEYLNVLPFPPEGAPTEEGDRLAGGS